MVDLDDGWVWEEATTYSYDELTIEKIESKLRACRHSATVYTDDHGHKGLEVYCCGLLICPKCQESRIKRKASEWSWMNNDKFVFKVFFENLNNTTSEELTDNRKVHLDAATMIRQSYPDLWFRFALLNHKMVLVINKEDEDILPGETITFDDFIKGYVDWTHVNDEDAIENLLITNRNHRRILGHGKKPDQEPTACNRSVSGFSLKVVGGEIISKSDLEESKIPIAEYMPIEKLKYIVDPEPLSGLKEPQTLDFKTFLQERINGKYLEEWEQYHGNLESKRMQKYIAWLLKVNPGVYGFINTYFEYIQQTKLMDSHS